MDVVTVLLIVLLVALLFGGVPMRSRFGGDGPIGILVGVVILILILKVLGVI